jgi:DNA polymerase I-like protein with 3'-5' exonuclease and polymerase domains
MIVDADFKQLEWLVASYLSQDPVAMKEILNGTDLHSDNQARLRLPTRLVAKTFLFRLIYGGSAYAYANDSEFAHISDSPKYWQRLIDEFYSKYKGLARWHSSLMQEVIRNQKLAMPTGREYEFTKNSYGDWPRTTILNYPVQGMGADLMAIARVSLFHKLRTLNTPNCLLVSTIHDSIILDVHRDSIRQLVPVIIQTWEDIPRNFQTLFGVEFNLPCKVEVKIGPHWGATQEVNLEDYK